MPKVDITVDHPTVATELNSSTMITVTARASGGFSGTVNLTAAAVDASDQPLPGWTVTLDAQSLNVGADSSSITVATLKIPSDSASLTGKVKITATAAGVTEGTLIASSEVTALNQVTIGMKLDNNGQCVYPPDGTLPIKVGSKLIFKNNQATTGNITIHMQTQNNDNTIGLKHEGDPGMAPGATYEQTVQNASANLVTWYCHAPGPTVNGLKIQAVP